MYISLSLSAMSVVLASFLRTFACTIPRLTDDSCPNGLATRGVVVSGAAAAAAGVIAAARRVSSRVHRAAATVPAPRAPRIQRWAWQCEHGERNGQISECK